MELKKRYIGAISFFLIIAWIWIPNNIVQSFSNKIKIGFNTFGNRQKPAIKVLLHVPPATPLEIIRSDCGQLCNTSSKGSPGPYFHHINADIDCHAIFRNKYVDRGHGLPLAPKSIPKNLMAEYTMNNRIPVAYWYFDSRIGILIVSI